MVSRTAFNQLKHSSLLLLGTIAGMPLIGVSLPLAALYYDGSAFALGAIFFVGWLFNGIFPMFMATVPTESVGPRQVATAMNDGIGRATHRHDAEIRGEVLGAIGREDGNAIATCEAALDQLAGDAVRHGRFREILYRSGLADRIGTDFIYTTPEEAFRAAEALRDAANASGQRIRS